MPESSSESVQSVQDQASALAGNEELVKALCDVDLSKYLADWLVEETGISRGKIVLGLKILTPIVASAGKGMAGFMAQGFKQRILSRLCKYKWTADLLSKLTAFCTQTAQQTEAISELKELLEQPLNRSKADVEHRKDLSLDLQCFLQQHDDLSELSDKMDFLIGLADKQPQFKDTFSAEIDRQRFVYRSQYIPFAGREEEMLRLTDFLKSDKPFAWMSVTGPGGIGKSRLGLEFCQRNGGAWRAGILADLDFDFMNWRPNQPTLLVIDYAATEQKRLQTILARLANRSRDFGYFVRVLLLERDNLKKDLKALDNDDDCQRSHRNADIVLGPPGPEALESIFRFFFVENGKAVPDDWTEHLHKLEEIDSKKRPLFAAYYANEVVVGECGEKCDRISLLRNVIRREEKNFWEPYGVTKEDKALLALATLTRGIGINMDDDLPPCVTPIRTLIQPENKNRFLALSGKVLQDEDGHPVQFVPPWEPDLVGELFVLNLLADDPDTGCPSSVLEPIMQSAWNMKAYETAVFLDRIRQDYLEHTTYRKLIPCEFVSTETAALLWSMAAFNLSHDLREAGKLEAADKLYSDIKALVLKHPENAEIALQQAKAAFNLSNELGEAGKWEAADNLYSDIKVLVLKHPDNAEIAEAQARAAVNLSIELGEAGKWEAAENLYSDIKALVLKHPENAEIALQQAMAAVNLSNGLGKAGKWEAAGELYSDIKALVLKHPENTEIALQQAMAAVNLSKDLGETGKLEASDNIYLDIKALVLKHPENAKITLRQAAAAAGSIIVFGKAEKLETAETFYSDIKMLGRKHPDADEIKFGQVIGGAALSLMMSKVEENSEKPKQLVSECLQICDEHAEDPRFVEARQFFE